MPRRGLLAGTSAHCPSSPLQTAADGHWTVCRGLSALVSSLLAAVVDSREEPPGAKSVGSNCRSPWHSCAEEMLADDDPSAGKTIGSAQWETIALALRTGTRVPMAMGGQARSLAAPPRCIDGQRPVRVDGLPGLSRAVLCCAVL